MTSPKYYPNDSEEFAKDFDFYMKKCLFLLLTLVTTGLYAQQKFNNPPYARNAQGLITLEDCPTEHPQLSVKMNDECNHVTIYLNGQVMQELKSEEEFVMKWVNDSNWLKKNCYNIYPFFELNFDQIC